MSVNLPEAIDAATQAVLADAEALTNAGEKLTKAAKASGQAVNEMSNDFNGFWPIYVNFASSAANLVQANLGMANLGISLMTGTLPSQTGGYDVGFGGGTTTSVQPGANVAPPSYPGGIPGLQGGTPLVDGLPSGSGFVSGTG